MLKVDFQVHLHWKKKKVSPLLAFSLWPPDGDTAGERERLMAGQLKSASGGSGRN